ncbi:Rpn family recombination-promoting nuclease/putative transposase [Nocardia higoensis]|uniref:Rpn family recombination-promoting nuclease/putative transposase n=2 Tax=Nocardia higoensis TaxID=228599 RepID=A0ABS0DDE5_9NOCA|nr:Rpn family recombination-promoting nuclease/putative transposase [Nocardia higoensis]
MSVAPANPHDALFRRIMARPDNAAGELRHVLPEAVVNRIDWAALRFESCSFVSPHLRSRYSDLLFSTRLGDRDTFIYVLVEHQTRPDRFMPLRMVEYMAAIWNSGPADAGVAQDRSRQPHPGRGPDPVAGGPARSSGRPGWPG